MVYSVLNPTGNITAIVTQWTQTDLAGAADRIMAAEPAVEQVGFLSRGAEVCDGALQMAGGEFCGNASMCAAAMLADEKGCKAGERMRITLRVSGSEEPVSVELEKLSSGGYRGKVKMPSALGISEILISEGEEVTVPLIYMPGIVHALVPEDFGIERTEKLLPGLCAQLKAAAMGAMLVDGNFSRISPVVYVPGANTLVREHSCASGTAAAGVWLSQKTGGNIRRSFTEPGGCLTVETNGDRLFIEGSVLLEKRSKI